ncbi:MAG: hypothetical protein ACOYYS_27205 [Chloroflexota bacterium]
MSQSQAEIIAEAQPVWGLDIQPAGCPACKAAYLVQAHRVGLFCPNCGRDRLSPQPARMRPEPPELFIPFRHSPTDLLPRLHDFVRPVWLRSDDLNAEALARRAVPVYLPAWLVDADLAGTWQAEMGFDYQVKSSQDSFAGNQWRSRDVLETRIRWEPRLGELVRHYDNIAVPAIENHSNQAALPGDHQPSTAIPYDPAQIGDAIVRIPDNTPEDVWNLAVEELDKATMDECRQAAGAQHVRQFAICAQHNHPNWTQLLHPIYVTGYTGDDGTMQMLYVNGRTGEVCGKRLASQRKGWLWARISLAIAALAFIVCLACTAIGALLPPFLLLSFLALVATLGAFTFAICTAVWPWEWNRRQ